MNHAKNTLVTDSSVKEGENYQPITGKISEGHEANPTTVTVETLNIKKERTRKLNFLASVPGLLLGNRREFQYFSRHLAMLKMVKGLDLDFSNSDLKKSKTLSPLSSTFKRLAGLENIKLTISCPKMSHKSLNHLGEFLKRMHSLERLSLDFSFCSYLPEAGLEALAKPLGGHFRLKEISLDLKCSGSNIQYFVKSFQSWRSLEKIALNLYGCGINDVSLGVLGEGLKELRTPLKSILLNFGFVGPVTENGVQVLCQGLEKHTLLENLELVFSGCIEITYRGLSYLGESLPKLSRLKTLSLGFDSCFDLNDNGLKDLGKGLEALSVLESLSLNFYSCNLTDESLKALTYNLEELWELTKIDYDFEKCVKITPEALADFELNMKDLVTRNQN